MPDQPSAVQRYREIADLLGGCHDGYCVITPTKGMRTNGGCRCLENMNFMERQKVGHLLRCAQQMADQLEAE